MKEAGFMAPRVHWLYDNRLFHFGRLLGNQLAAYFHKNLFRLEMERGGY